MARLATILSFGDHADDAEPVPLPEQHADYREEQEHDDDAASDASDDSFEFAFARPLGAAPDEADALADDLFAHGRIVPAYPVFRRNGSASASSATASSATAPPSPDSYCAWTPRSAPGSPAREPGTAFPKSASTGQAVPRFRLRDLVGAGAGRRSHSDGKEKFLFLQPTPKPKSSKPSAPSVTTAAQEKQAAKKPSSQKPKQQSKKKGAAAPVTEMDMATAHRLFYSKPGAAASATGASERPSTTTKKSYLPYRPAIVGFFAAAHGLRPKHHPY